MLTQSCLHDLCDALDGLAVQTPAGLVHHTATVTGPAKDAVVVRLLDAAGHRIGAGRRAVDGGIVFHTGFGMDEPGTGLLPLLVDAWVAAYAQAGFDQVRLSAAAIGAYAWARVGFGLATRADRQELAAHLRTVADTGHGLPLPPVQTRRPIRDPDGLRDLADAVELDVADVADVAQFGRATPDDGWHDGKVALVNAHWRGVRHLTP